jgi:hypothetical protein
MDNAVGCMKLSDSGRCFLALALHLKLKWFCHSLDPVVVFSKISVLLSLIRKKTLGLPMGYFGYAQ